MVDAREYWKFNLYDVFSNFLPGAILLIGLFLPLVGPSELLVNLKIGSAIVLIILAFSAGLAIQVLGGIISSSHDDFVAHMSKVVSEDDDEGVSAVDVQFIEYCRSEHGFSAKFEDWEKLFKIVLAQLEERSSNRTIRLHALYLAMRGMVISMFILTIYFLIYGIGVWCDVFVAQLPSWGFVVFTPTVAISAVIFWLRQNEFNKDITTYMISEYQEQENS